MNNTRPNPLYWLTVLLIINGISAFFLQLNQPIEHLIQSLPDDAFYYLKIARNIVSGQGISFDGYNQTNGFHPLWMVLITPLAALFSQSDSFLYASLALGLLFNLISIYMLFRITQLLHLNSSLSLFILTLFSLNPFYLSQANNGLESSLNILSLLFFIFSYLSIVLEQSTITNKKFLILALSCAVMLLSRLDNIFLAMSVFFFLSLFKSKELPRLFISGLLVCVLLSPYLYWNIKNFGYPVPVSGLAETLRTKDYFLSDPNHISSQTYLFSLMKAYFTQIVITNFGSKLVLYLVIIFLVIYAWWKYRVTELKFAAKVAIPLIMSILLQVGSIEIRWIVRYWYYLSSLPILMVTFAIFLTTLKEKETNNPWNCTFLIILALSLNLFSLYKNKSVSFDNININQKTLYEGALWMNKHLPNKIVGVFNSGIIGYFYQGNIVNLDGVVNNQAYSYIKSHQLMNYILKNKIQYLADLSFALKNGNPMFLGSGYQKQLKLITSVKNENQLGNDFLIYKIIMPS